MEAKGGILLTLHPVGPALQTLGTQMQQRRKRGHCISCRLILIPFVSCLIFFVTDWASARVYLLVGEGQFRTFCSGEGALSLVVGKGPVWL